MSLARVAAARRQRRDARRIPNRAARRARSAREPRAAVLAFSKDLRARLARFEAEIERVLFPVLDELIPSPGVTSAPDEPDARTRVDAASLPRRVASKLELLEVYLEEIFDERSLDGMLGTIGKAVEGSNARELRRVIGVSIRTADPGVAAQITSFRAFNVDLIKSLAGKELQQITTILERSEGAALRVETLRKQLQERFGVSRSKADLLARDQTLKLNAQIAKERQTNAGITEYIWTTSGDDRVRGLDPKDRTDHAALDGTRQRWDTPPDVGDGRHLHPGEDYQCRCTAFPVLVELE